MLGKGSNALLGKTSKLILPCGKERDRAAGEDCEQQTSVNALVSSKPPFLPQQVIVGFDIRQEPKPFDPCESPRSVLDLNVLSRENRAPGGSFRSFLGPLKNKGSQGVGLAIIVELHAEEKRFHGSLSPMARTTATDDEQAHYYRQHQSQPITIELNSKDKQSAFRLRKCIQFDESVDGDFSSIGSAMDTECLVPDNPRFRHEHLGPSKMTGDAEDGYDARPSIFSVASIPSSHGSFGSRSMSFLDTCAFCKRSFSPAKDVFMYRGNQAFCSAECRVERIKIEEYKEKASTLFFESDSLFSSHNSDEIPDHLLKITGTVF